MFLESKSSNFHFPILRFFLLEQATERVYGVGRILRLLQQISSWSGATKLRLEQACRSPADIGDKFRIGGRAVDLKRNARPFAPALASADRAQNAADSRCRHAG